MSVQNVKNKPYLIGLTGGIASGKTTVAHFFREHGVPVIDSDTIVKELWEKDHDMVKEIEDAFGIDMSQHGKKILTDLIFHDDQKRMQLNRIIHPKVFLQIEKEKNALHHEPIIMIDMPLLIEVGYQKEVDYVVLVFVDQQTQLKRLMDRDHISEKEAYFRINSQMSLEEKKAYANLILDNTQDIQNLKITIQNFLNQIKHEKQ